MNEEQKNLKSVKGMTKWQRMRFEMLVSASGAFIRALTYVIFIAMFLMLATRMQSQTWYNWKNDEYVAKLEQRISSLEQQNGSICDTFGTRAAELTIAEMPHKAMRAYWKSNEHPSVDDSSMQDLNDLLGDELLEKFNNWIWKHIPIELFLICFGVVCAFFIVLFEGPLALFKLFFKKDKEDDEEEQELPNPPSDEELVKWGMTREEWNDRNDERLKCKSEFEKLKKEVQEWKIPDDLEKPKKD